MAAETAADRELRAEATIDASPAAVWAVLADVRRMPELSPELVRMVPLKPGGLRPGQWYLGLNRRKAVLWPTRSVVSEVEPDRAVAWDTRSSGARWIWELTPDGSGTRVVHRRPVPRQLTGLSLVFAKVFLGGVGGHADELEEGMAVSVARLKRAVEGS
ncbi:MAG TPA: SRPBCC family protein [Nocardioides sp.]|uniref:SRPBCC family protein n=1 Tax=uncultured Nocardioides sp. TaxID=198441 RepID=UPI000EE729B0|nr:SRPBCC family protein [uncultured Nocardioides sp.]HCB03809.1 SRPBCC family protein [Nocardioides sp.]HRD61453.1 SRPBCC family protein [Nocardioides sp.]HRI96468.1 SRPBCC family protein [Nocardioides sp.]HRK45347.1 SRPBCC family protein [Nocardioides sp.]